MLIVVGLDLHPFYVAILSQMPEEVSSMLADSPQRVFDTLWGMTVLHLSAKWPTGLSLLLSKGAQNLVNNKASAGPSYRLPPTPLDVALYYDNADSAQLLFDHGAIWHLFNDRWNCSWTERSVRVVARNIAMRRRQLAALAKQALTTEDWHDLGLESEEEVVDQQTTWVLRKSKDAGMPVPDVLTVPESYEGVYFNGNLDIAHLPIFFEEGFSGLNERNSQGLLPLVVADPTLYLRTNDESLRTHRDGLGILDWLQEHSYLELSLTDPQSLGLNTTATGWHFMAVRTMPIPWPYHQHNWAGDSDMVRQQCFQQVQRAISSSQVADTCDCWCSEGGCRPLHIYLKTMALVSFWLGELKNFRLDVNDSGPNQVSMLDFLRFITFEALEMTHTCCYTREIVVAGTSNTCEVLMQFDGDSKDIHDEEKELAERLIELMDEFRSFLEETDVSLESFVWGYWKRRMAEVCIPDNENPEDLAKLGVKIDNHCESPSLPRLLVDGTLTWLDRTPERLQKILCFLREEGNRKNFDFYELQGPDYDDDRLEKEDDGNVEPYTSSDKDWVTETEDGGSDEEDQGQ